MKGMNEHIVVVFALSLTGFIGFGLLITANLINRNYNYAYGFGVCAVGCLMIAVGCVSGPK